MAASETKQRRCVRILGESHAGNPVSLTRQAALLSPSHRVPEDQFAFPTRVVLVHLSAATRQCPLGVWAESYGFHTVFVSF